MSDVIRIYAADFGPGRTGLATVGYTLTGQSRVTAGVGESPAGSGIYQASITHDSLFTGAIVWDLGISPNAYAVETVSPGVPGPQGASGATPSASPAGALATTYCTDEDVAIRAPQDFVNLVPKWQKLAGGADGQFLAGSPWSMRSTSTAWETAGVAKGHVVWLSRPVANFNTPGGELMAVESVSDNTVRLRRLGQVNGAGLAPAPVGGLSGVTFAVYTFGPQIDNASYDANKLFGIDPNIGSRAPSDLYDRRELQQFVVLMTLRRAYVAADKQRAGDYADKLALVSHDFEELKARLVVHWGAAADAKAPTMFAEGRVRR